MLNTLKQTNFPLYIATLFSIYEDDPINKCIGCDGRATKTNNTLCQSCWNDAEGFDE